MIVGLLAVDIFYFSFVFLFTLIKAVIIIPTVAPRKIPKTKPTINSTSFTSFFEIKKARSEQNSFLAFSFIFI